MRTDQYCTTTQPVTSRAKFTGLALLLPIAAIQLAVGSSVPDSVAGPRPSRPRPQATGSTRSPTGWMT